MTRDRVRIELATAPATAAELAERLDMHLSWVRSAIWFLVHMDRTVRARPDGKLELGDPGVGVPTMKGHV